MARIKNVDLPNDKRIEVALTYIHGIGRKLSRQILTKLNINLDTKAKDLTDEEKQSFFSIRFGRQKNMNSKELDYAIKSIIEKLLLTLGISESLTKLIEL